MICIENVFVLRVRGTSGLFIESIQSDGIKRDKLLYAEYFETKDFLVKFIKDNKISLDEYEIIPIKIQYNLGDDE